jgi:YggT family protein
VAAPCVLERKAMAGLILLLLQLYLLVLIGRAIFTWFPPRRGGAADSVNRVLFNLTEPVLGPIRRALPRTGRIDLSFLVVFIGIIFLQQLFANA